MVPSSTTLKAAGIAFVIFIVLTTSFIYVWRYREVSFLRSEEALVFAILLSIGLVTVIVYQSIKIGVTARYLATHMAKDMTLYSRELFTELYRNSPVPYVLIDAKQNVLSLNAAALRLFMTQDGALTGQNIFSYIRGDGENEKAALIPEYFKQGMPVNDIEVEIVRTDGESRWVLLSLFAFKDATRERRGLITLVDITKQKEVDRVKTEFVSLASHQLRTPISAMKWNLELLRQVRAGKIEELEEMYLTKIERGALRMDLLIGDFLNVSKLELGTFVPTYEDVTIGAFLNTVLEEYEERARARTITIEREWGELAEYVFRTDSHLLNMAVSNLISNAVKYTVDGGTVSVRVHGESNHLIFTISDTGIGIPEDERDRIFTKIFRASNAKKQVEEGTGLGLYIVREALKVLGGTVDFISTENVGTTFTIVLPVT